MESEQNRKRDVGSAMVAAPCYVERCDGGGKAVTASRDAKSDVISPMGQLARNLVHHGEPCASEPVKTW